MPVFSLPLWPLWRGREERSPLGSQPLPLRQVLPGLAEAQVSALRGLATLLSLRMIRHRPWPRAEPPVWHGSFACFASCAMPDIPARRLQPQALLRCTSDRAAMKKAQIPNPIPEG